MGSTEALPRVRRYAAMTADVARPRFETLLDYRPARDLLTERIILVTGAAEGIGREAAALYAAHGAQTILLDWNQSGLEAAYDAFCAAGWPAPVLCPVDLSGATLQDLCTVVARIEEAFGRLDGLLNNAGWIGALTPFEHQQPNVWGKVFNINLAAPFFLTQWCMALLKRSADPAIVFSLHETSRAFWGAYGVAKAGLEALVHILADEYHPRSAHPMRVIGIDTGPVTTAERRRHYAGEVPGTAPPPQAVAAPYLYAMGPDARGHTDLILRRGGEGGP
jgi:NAD(P)-dependent dehydrogenase (short-subunit alcohol dehydrogenase family)